MGKFKKGDKVRLRENYSTWPAGTEGTVEKIIGGDLVYTDTVEGAYDYRFELVLPTTTIEPGKHYRLRNGKMTGRISQGDIGFEAIVDGQVKVFDKAGGHVFGNGEFDIVEAWVPKVGERVRFTQNNPNGGKEFGLKGEDFEVATSADNGDSGYGVQIQFKHPKLGWTPRAPLHALEPLYVAAPLRIEVGRFYKTRDGRKVGPMEERRESYGTEYVWHHDRGRRIYKADGTNYDPGANDLIAEWVDEPVVAVANDNVDAAKPANVPKFKVGDVVRVTATGDTYQDKYKGSTFTIDSNEGYLDDEQSWSGRDHGSPYRWKESQLELASTATPTAIVALIEDGQPKPAILPHVHASVESATSEAERLAGLHRGQRFGVYVLHDTRETDLPDYGHEWKNLAARGQKIAAIKELRSLTGLNLVAAKTAVEKWAEYELAA